MGVRRAALHLHRQLTRTTQPTTVIPTTISALKSLGAGKSPAVAGFAKFAQKVVDNKWVVPSKRIFNGAKAVVNRGW